MTGIGSFPMFPCSSVGHFGLPTCAGEISQTMSHAIHAQLRPLQVLSGDAFTMAVTGTEAFARAPAASGKFFCLVSAPQQAAHLPRADAERSSSQGLLQSAESLFLRTPHGGDHQTLTSFGAVVLVAAGFLTLMLGIYRSIRDTEPGFLERFEDAARDRMPDDEEDMLPPPVVAAFSADAEDAEPLPDIAARH